MHITSPHIKYFDNHNCYLLPIKIMLTFNKKRGRLMFKKQKKLHNTAVVNYILAFVHLTTDA